MRMVINSKNTHCSSLLSLPSSRRSNRMIVLRALTRVGRRCTVMVRSKYCLLALLLLMVICLGDTLAQWRASQRPLRMSGDMALQEMAKLADLTDMKRFYADLRRILVPRIVNTPQHRQVGEFMADKLQAAGFHTEWNEFHDTTPLGSVPFRNLIATFNPHTSRRLVLACHYDTLILRNQVFVGAIDSAVPCAMMLDMARTLGPMLQAQPDLPVTLQLIFFDGEEAMNKWSDTDSTYGSRHLAARWASQFYPTSSRAQPLELSREIDRIDVLVLLDLLGAPNPRISHSLGHGSLPLFGSMEDIETRLKASGKLRRIAPIFSSRDAWHAVEDDHVPFMTRGVPVMHLIPVPFPAVWHTPSDNAKALDDNTIYNLLSIIRVFTAQYLGLVPTRA